MQFTTLALTALLSLASAQTVHVVSVSTKNNTLVYSPERLSAPVGDMIQFQFRGGNHTVTQSTFDNPCQPISMHVSNQTGIWSGFQAVAASAASGMVPTYTIRIANTTPMWLYCSQGKHCQSGMVMVINENTAANASRSLENFKSLAKQQTQNLPGTATNAGTNNGGSNTGSGTATGTGSGSTASGTNSANTPATTAGASTMVISGSLSLAAAAAALLVL